jgi:SAM-dependent methyltransferase
MTSEDRPPALETTGERLVPELQHGELVHAEHLARYRLAAQLADGRRVLDAACGEGYGTAILAQGGASAAVGVDIDEATVAHAAQRHGLDFRAGDVGALPFEDGSFDLVVSFETIEHVPEPERALDEFARVLAPDGLLVISTPNKLRYLVENEFHVREFTHHEFAALLRGRFPSVRLVYQSNWLASGVFDRDAFADASGERRHEPDLYKVVGGEPGDELYTIALCGERTDAELRDVVVSANVDEAHELARRTVSAEEAADKWHSEFEKAKQTAEEWHDRAQEAMETARWMSGTLSWRLTKPFRAPGKLRRDRGG